MRAIVIFAAACLAGCTTHSHVHYGSSAYGVSVSASGGTALAVLLGAAFFTSAYQMDRQFGEAPRAAPELAPDRRVAEVDCTQPVDWSRGNIRCK